MLYVRMGVIKSRFAFHQSTVQSGYTSNYSYDTVTGGQVGLGIQGTVYKCVALRAEYDYNSYRTFSAFANRISVSDNQVKAGLVFYLG